MKRAMDGRATRVDRRPLAKSFKGVAQRHRGRLAMAAVLAGALSCLSVVDGASAQGRFEWQEFGARASAAGDVASLTTDVLGDAIDLYSGNLSFTATDVDLPGTGPAVRFTRRFSVLSRDVHARYNDHGLRDWEVELPTISGSYAPDWMPVVPQPGSRCSLESARAAIPPVQFIGLAVLEADSYWNGLQLELPDGGGGELLFARQDAPMPESGGPYRWLTTGGARVSCLPSLLNRPGGGEGFQVRTPDGMTYDFNHMAQFEEANLLVTYGFDETDVPPPIRTESVSRRRNVLYATKVTDRFGNTVDYQYANAWHQPARLVSIVASDGRRIDVSYVGDRVSTVSANGANCAQAGTRCWRYEYLDVRGRGLYNYASLSRVTQPDGQAWEIGFGGLADAHIEYGAPTERSCMSLPDAEGPQEFNASITHPSGLRGEFVVGIQRLGRAQVPLSCRNVTVFPESNNPSDDVPNATLLFDAFVVRSKTISGPGVHPRRWTYVFERDVSYQILSGRGTHPSCPLGQGDCAAPLCSSDACAGSARALVAESGGNWQRHTFGNTHGYDEGKLRLVEVGRGTEVLRTTRYQHDFSLLDTTYMARWGFSARQGRAGFTAEYHRPTVGTGIHQQAVNFDQSVVSFDAFARPTHTTNVSSSSGLPARLVETGYFDDRARWVLGQKASERVGGVLVSSVGYNAFAQPETIMTNGLLDQTVRYHGNGNVATTVDARSNATTFGDWYRGVPKVVGFPPTPESPQGASLAAQVDDSGWITSATDENGFTTDYGYDAMGRLQRVDYPAEDAVAWAPTRSDFVREPQPVMGLEAGHWRLTTQTGTAIQTRRFDALLRPVIEESLDAQDAEATRSVRVKRYDDEGNLAFESYAVRTLTDYRDASLAGVRSIFDALGRPLSVSVDAEDGMTLTTQYRYLPGFMTETVNPRGKSSVTSYLAWEQPTSDFPVRMASPESVVTRIERDVFGKPLSIQRSGAD